MNITAFAALIRRKRGEAELTQETLELDVFGDSARNADTSRLENARTPNPQEASVQKLCTALNISAAEMEPIRQSRVSAAQLNQIPTLSREELENIATRFQIDDVFDRKDADLRQLLTHKATEYRALKSQVDAMKRLSNLKAAAQDAIARVDLDEVENLMTLVHATELEEAAKSAEIRADTALLRGNVDHAFTLLSTTADSFAQVDPFEPARRRILTYCATLYNHGVRYSGTGLNAAEKLVATQLTPDLETDDPLLWAAGQNARPVMLQTQGTRTDGEKGADLLAEAVSAYRAALEVRTRADHPVDWAMTQNNIAIAQLTIAKHATYSDPSSALDEALTAVDKSLTVFDPVHMPYYHGTATRLRAQIRAQIDALS